MKKQNPVISSMTCWTIPQNCRRFDRVLTFLTSIYRESKVGQVRTVLKVHLSLYACVCVCLQCFHPPSVSLPKGSDDGYFMALDMGIQCLLYLHETFIIATTDVQLLIAIDIMCSCLFLSQLDMKVAKWYKAWAET